MATAVKRAAAECADCAKQKCISHGFLLHLRWQRILGEEGSGSPLTGGKRAIVGEKRRVWAVRPDALHTHSPAHALRRRALPCLASAAGALAPHCCAVG